MFFAGLKMRTLTLVKRESIFKKGVAVNLGRVCTLFVLLGVVLSFLFLMQSVNEEERIEQLKSEELAAVASMMRDISHYIDSGDIDRAKTSSLHIRENGMLSSVSALNRRRMYEFLSDISRIEESEYTRYAAYARSCCASAIKELSGVSFELDEWKTTKSDSYKLSAKNAISIAKSMSNVDLYPRHYYFDRNICTYNSNYYRKLDFYETQEFVNISESVRGAFDDSCDIGYLKEQIMGYFGGDIAVKEQVSFLFVDMGVAFFRVKRDGFYTLVGISADGKEMYLYSEESERANFL